MMSTREGSEEARGAAGPPLLRRDAAGRVEPASLAGVIEWFLNYDWCVAAVRHPRVAELFGWKQAEDRGRDENSYEFGGAEDRLAVGIMQALATHRTEPDLHEWVGQLLESLDEARKINAEISSAYKLESGDDVSVLREAEKIPAARERALYLTCCWLEVLCTSEVLVLGWAYQELYGRPFAPR